MRALKQTHCCLQDGDAVFIKGGEVKVEVICRTNTSFSHLEAAYFRERLTIGTVLPTRCWISR